MRTYSKALILLLIFLSTSLLWAFSHWDTLISEARQKVQQNPEDSENRLLLGYYLMMNYQPGDAEGQYRAVAEANPNNLSAWEGLAWALSVQGKIQASKALMKDMKAKYPANPAFQNQYAFALMLQDSYPLALSYYKNAKNLAMMEPLQKDIATKGMGWAYRSLNDLSKADKSYRAADIQMDRLGFRTALFYGNTASNKFFAGVSQSAEYGTWKLSGAYEDFLIDGESYRRRNSLSVAKQFSPVDIRFGAVQLDSDDAVYYPVRSFFGEFSPKLYFSGMLLKPNIMAAFTHYPRFDNQQISFNPVLYFYDFSFSYAVQAGFLDSEYMAADETQIVHKVSLNKHLPLNLNAGIHFSQGDDSWQSSSTGALTDNPNNAQSTWAASLEYAPTRYLSIYGYYQKGEYRDLIYTSISLSY